MKSNDKEYDDLTAIKGIGRTRQEWFRKSFKVRMFHDLASLSVDEIESHLKAAGKIVNHSQIEQWIIEAQRLAAVSQSSQQDMVSADVEAVSKVNSQPEEAEWEWLGAFIVDFRVSRMGDQVIERQIKVEHRKTDIKGTWLEDDNDKNFIIVDGQQLYPWMVEQLDDKLWQESDEHITQTSPAETTVAKISPTEAFPDETAPEEAPITEVATAAVEISQINLFQPPDVETPIDISLAHQPFTGFISGGEPFTLEVAFELPAAYVANIANRQTTYNAQFHMRNLTTGAKISLGNTRSDSPVAGQMSYTARLFGVTLPPGLYRMGVLVMILNRPPQADYLEIPMLQVV